MKKKVFQCYLHIIIIMCLSVNVSHLNAQEILGDSLGQIQYKAIYKLLARLDTTDKTNLVRQERVLYIASESSTYLDKNQIARDSFLATISTNVQNGNSSVIDLKGIPQASYAYRIFKNRTKKNLTLYGSIYQMYKYSEDGDLFSWQLKDSLASIAGYKCRQAETQFRGRHYTAWFTNEIPIEDGPYKFYGLPGLIISISDDNNDYVFELTSFEKAVGSLVITLPKSKAILTTKENFLKMEKNRRENPIEIASQNGVTLKDPEAVRVRNMERLKHNNNPIELTEK